MIIKKKGKGENSMGTYLNPGNSGFAEIMNCDYQDKTGMIGLINDRINTPNKLICISRPRRFGKSYAAKMLCAYYDHTCNSARLFDGTEIGLSENYQDRMNKYNVIYLDIAGFVSDVKRRDGNMKAVVNEIAEAVRQELIADRPELKEQNKLSKCMLEYVETTNMKLVFIIDEWDAIIREAKNDSDTQEAYLSLLREWFKNGNFTSKAVAAAYMTGILPIKKDKSQSAISDFDEYTVLEPGEFSDYIGFTEKEVKTLCEKSGMSFGEAKQWYDGYTFSDNQSIYNPYSIMRAMRKKVFRSYWQHTSAAENLETLININKDGLQEDILKLIAGEQLIVNTNRFKNDFTSFSSKDDVLTLLTHLGYLVYNNRTRRVRIPNEEVRFEFEELLQNAQHTQLADLITASELLLKDTLSCNETAVADTIAKVRETNYAPMFYNNEQALRYVIKFAYIVCIDYYLKVEELPTDNGIADVVFIPKRDTSLPAMIVELKWNESAESAVEQIKKKNYPAILTGYEGELVLVGINYNEKTKDHSCKIERIDILQYLHTIGLALDTKGTKFAIISGIY